MNLTDLSLIYTMIRILSLTDLNLMFTIFRLELSPVLGRVTLDAMIGIVVFRFLIHTDLN